MLGLETRARLKEAAQRLFSERGVEGVSIDQMLAAAGQRNKASLHYHFGTKLDLVRELVVDGAKVIDEQRQAMLDQLEEEGEITVRKLMEALVLPVLGLDSVTGQATYVRMIANLQLNNRAALREALAGTWNTGYRRCMEHMARLIPQISGPILEQRLSLSSMAGNAFLAAWERSRDQGGQGSTFWSPPFTLDNVLDALVGIVSAPPAASTLDKLHASPGAHATGLRQVKPSRGEDASSGESLPARRSRTTARSRSPK
jgi:AcrR family transcriptional regulator